MDLFKYQDLKYKLFNDKIINTNYETIGIRMPILKKLAKEIAKSDYHEYFNKEHKYYEEYMIYGLIIGYLKLPFIEILNLLDSYIPYIDNWACVDTTVSNLKCFKDNLNDGYKYILKLIKGDTYSIRFGLVLLLNYYIKDEYIDHILNLILNIKNNEYYVMMAKAWLLSYTYINYKEKTLQVLMNPKIDKVLVNKTISKICDSYRLNSKDKEEVRSYRRWM